MSFVLDKFEPVSQFCKLFHFKKHSADAPYTISAIYNSLASWQVSAPELVDGYVHLINDLDIAKESLQSYFYLSALFLLLSYRALRIQLLTLYQKTHFHHRECGVCVCTSMHLWLSP